MVENVPSTATLAVLPEGNMVNFLSRHSNPTPYPSFTLPELQSFGEENMVEAYRQRSPDYIVLIHRDSTEYGFRHFGQDERFGAATMRWIRANYVQAHLIGHEPFQTDEFGIKILKRAPAR